MVVAATNWVDISTVIAASAALWALGFAWVTYATSVHQQNEDEYQALKSIVAGLHIELALMKDWTAAGGQGYSKTMESPPDWSLPSRLIWKFDIGAISNLTRSPYLYRLDAFVGPFARLNFSVSRLFQLYDEYRSFVNSDPSLFLGKSAPVQHLNMIQQFNRTMHVDLIGGADSSDPNCLYKAYDAAAVALNKFESSLKSRKLPWWFWAAHLVCCACFVSGTALLYELPWNSIKSAIMSVTG